MTVRLSDNPTNDEITAALAVVTNGGAVESASIEPIDQIWPLAVVRYVAQLGPDRSDNYGVMAYERVATVARMSEGATA